MMSVRCESNTAQYLYVLNCIIKQACTVTCPEANYINAIFLYICCVQNLAKAVREFIANYHCDSISSVFTSHIYHSSGLSALHKNLCRLTLPLTFLIRPLCFQP